MFLILVQLLGQRGRVNLAEMNFQAEGRITRLNFLSIYFRGVFFLLFFRKDIFFLIFFIASNFCQYQLFSIFISDKNPGKNVHIYPPGQSVQARWPDPLARDKFTILRIWYFALIAQRAERRSKGVAKEGRGAQ